MANMKRLKRRERISCTEREDGKEAEAEPGSSLRTAVTRWQHFAAQHLLLCFLTACCLTIDPPGLCAFIQLYVSGWAEEGG